MIGASKELDDFDPECLGPLLRLFSAHNFLMKKPLRAPMFLFLIRQS
jgi:hypothetical protein